MAAEESTRTKYQRERLPITAYMSRAEIKALDALAKADGRTRSDWVRRVVQSAIRDQSQEVSYEPTSVG